jgi:hypothetical protein
MGKMGQVLEDRLDKYKYEMWELIQAVVKAEYIYPELIQRCQKLLNKINGKGEENGTGNTKGNPL